MNKPSLEQRLNQLFSLQQIDSQLQEIESQKGDLPATIEQMENSINNLKNKIKDLQRMIKQWKIDQDNYDMEIIDLTEKIEKYKNHQLHVKTNKQYDALAKEIDRAEEKIQKYEKEMEILDGNIKVGKTDLESMTRQLEETTAELEEKQKELREINREHQRDRTRLIAQRTRLVEQILKEDLERYERIRKAKNGIAVSPIKRNSCGGCFNRIPPQKSLEIRQNLKIFVCEHCGRILVSDEIISNSTQPMHNY